MPNVKDSPMLLAGNVANVEATTFDGKPTGLKVLVASGDGFALVKIKTENVRAAGTVTVGTRVALVVRPIYWEMENGSGMSVQFIRHVEPADVDYLAASMLDRAQSPELVGA